jgi:hypothetical protein
MLKLPSKKWRKVRINHLGENKYKLFFVSPIHDVQEMKVIIEEDIEICLGKNDKMVNMEWETKSVLYEICDYEPFVQRLLDVNIIITEQN